MGKDMDETYGHWDIEFTILIILKNATQGWEGCRMGPGKAK